MIELYLALIVFERCYLAQDNKTEVCVSKPVPALTCFRTGQRLECIQVPYLARRFV